MYGMPFIRPTQKQLHQLNSIFIRPIRLALRLPITTHQLSLYVEANCPTISLYRESQLLTYAHRVSSFSQQQVITQLFKHEYQTVTAQPVLATIPTLATAQQDSNVIFNIPAAASIPSIASISVQQSPIIATRIPKPKRRKERAMYKQSIIDELTNIESLWKCSHNDAELKPKQIMYDQLHQQWQQSDGGKILKEIKKKPSKSWYLYLEPRRIHIYRAQLRFNRCNWNESLYKRKLTNSPYCRYPSCSQQHKNESVQHVLLECPQFQTQRRELKIQLKHFKLKLTLQTILGDVYPNHKKKVEDKWLEAMNILKLTYSYIQHIHQRKSIMINK